MTAAPVVEQGDLFAAAEAERDRVLAAVNANADEWDKQVVDNCILATIEEYGEASANEVRDRVPEIRHRSLIGARFNSLRMSRRIVKVRRVVSTDEATHGKEIWTYRLVTP